MALKTLVLFASLLAGASAGLAEKAGSLEKAGPTEAEMKHLVSAFKSGDSNKLKSIAKKLTPKIQDLDRRKAAYPDDDGSCPDEYSAFFSCIFDNLGACAGDDDGDDDWDDDDDDDYDDDNDEYSSDDDVLGSFRVILRQF